MRFSCEVLQKLPKYTSTTYLLTALAHLAIQELIAILARDPLDPDRRGVRLADEGSNNNPFFQLDPNTYIFGPPESKRQRLVLIKAEDMEAIYEKDEITTDLLGFYSLLMSYVNVAANADEIGKSGLLYYLRSACSRSTLLLCSQRKAHKAF
jgi:hypothetical protein